MIFFMAVCGHQSETSIRSYAFYVDDKKKKDMAMSISATIPGCKGSQSSLQSTYIIYFYISI